MFNGLLKARGLEMSGPPCKVEQSTRLSFSIRGVLLATTLCAVAAAPVGWLGPIYAISAVVSLLLLGAATLAIARKEVTTGVVGCFVAAFASALLFSSGLFFQAVATFAVCLLSLAVPDRVRPLTVTCVVVMLLAYVPTIRHAIASDQRIDAMRERWPFATLRDRLPVEEPSHMTIPVSLSAEQSATLAHLDEETKRSAEFWLPLERVHSEAQRRFARSPFFGVSRMGPVRRVLLDSGDQWRREYEATGLPVRLDQRADSAGPIELHRRTQTAFLLADRLGYVVSPDRVAGFAGHGFGRLPFEHRSRWDEESARDGVWSIDRLDLIGLVLHDEPMAYVSETLPNMEELREAPTRPLTEFEANAVALFHGQEDLLIDERVSAGETQLRMVGAIRAGKSCVTCHEVPFGTLLGAFSYDLTRSAQEPITPARSRPSAGG